MYEYDPQTIEEMRSLARKGATVEEIYQLAKSHSGGQPHILPMLALFRDAFSLSLLEAKPIAALTRNDNRDVIDAARLEELVSPAIQANRFDWDLPIQPSNPLPATLCPYCDEPLRTSAARQCFDCGMDWHDPKRVMQRGSSSRHSENDND